MDNPRCTIPGLYRICSGVLPIVSSHLLVEGDQAVLVDTGRIGHHRIVQRLFARLGLAPSQLKAVLQTHGHLDHVDRLSEVLDWSGAPCYMHHADWPIAMGRYAYRDAARVCGLMEAVGRRLIGYTPVEFDHELTPGETLPYFGGLEVIHLPGHTEGHCGFWSERHRLLLAGDLVAAYPAGVHRSPPIFNAVPDRFAESFERVLEIEPEHVVLNHYVRLDTRAQAKKLLRYAQRYLKSHGG